MEGRQLEDLRRELARLKAGEGEGADDVGDAGEWLQPPSGRSTRRDGGGLHAVAEEAADDAGTCEPAGGESAAVVEAETEVEALRESANSGAVLLEADSAAEGPASERSYEESTLRSLPPHLADSARAGASGDGGLLSDLQEEALRLSDERDALLRTGVYTPGDEVGASCFLPSLPALHSPHLWPSN